MVVAVVRDRWVDWNFHPTLEGFDGMSEGGSVEVLVERLESDDSLWVFVVGRGRDGEEVRVPVRVVS